MGRIAGRADDACHDVAGDALRLQVCEAHLRGILASASEGIVTADESQTIVMANAAAAEIFRCRVADLLGAPLERLLPERLRGRHRAAVAAFGATESSPRAMGGRGDLLGLRADGEEFPLAAGISLAHVDGVRFYTVILRDLGEARRAAAALRSSEDLLAATFDASVVPMAQLDPSTRRIVAANAAFCRLCGYDAAELATMDVDQLNHPDDPVDPAKFGALLEGRAGYEEEKRHVRKDGRVVWVHASGSVVRDAHGRPVRVVGVVQDITARREAEQALRAREARQSFLVCLNDRLRPLHEPEAIAAEAARMLGEFVGASCVGYAEDAGDGERISWLAPLDGGRSPLPGGEQDDVLAPALLQARRAGHTVVRPDIATDRTLTAAQRAGFARAGVAASVEVPLVGAGRPVAVLFVQSPTPRDWTSGEVALLEDVAGRLRADLERARAEAEVRVARAKLEVALESMNDAVFISDAEGRFVDFNTAFATFHRFTGKSECRLTLAEYPDLFDVWMADGTPAPLDQWAVPRALRGETVSNAEYHLRRKDTGERWTGSYSFAPIRDAEGRIVGSVVTGRDITGIKRMQGELQASHAELQRLVAAVDRAQEAERLRVARELHDDTQQALAALLMDVTIARAALGRDDPAAADALTRIERVARRTVESTRRIIRDLRPQALEELGLVAALEGLASEFAGLTGIACAVDAGELDAADEPRPTPLATCLYRVAQEALNNVAKHAGAAAVTIALRSRPGGGLRLSIADDGVGVAAGPARRDAFGLLGMRERVRASGGTLRVLNPAAGGTTVDVEIPRADAAEAAP